MSTNFQYVLARKKKAQMVLPYSVVHPTKLEKVGFEITQH
jgi:hypothetical protein